MIPQETYYPLRMTRHCSYLTHMLAVYFDVQINIEVNNLFNWFCANKLCLNPTKTKYIVIKPNNHICHYDKLSIMINGKNLSQIGNQLQFDEQSTTFLGIYIDESLSWKHHINHINKKISRALFCIKQVQNLLPTNTQKHFYYSTINPHLTYGIFARYRFKACSGGAKAFRGCHKELCRCMFITTQESMIHLLSLKSLTYSLLLIAYTLLPYTISEKKRSAPPSA